MCSDHSLAKGNFAKTKMLTCCVNCCSNQSRLNKNICYYTIRGKERKDIRDVCIKATFKLGCFKISHVCPGHFMGNYFDEIQELKQCLLGSQSRPFLLTADAVPSLFPNMKDSNKLR